VTGADPLPPARWKSDRPPPEAARPQVRVSLAIGPGGRLSRRILARRYAYALTLVLLLGLGKILIAQRVVSVETAAASDRVVASGLVIGAAPADSDLQELSADLRVDGVVNLGVPSVAEQVTASSLHQAYLYLPLPAGAAPTWTELRDLAGFVRRYRERGDWVYMHDDTGGPRAVTTSAMLLLLRGQTWAAMSAEMTPAGLGSVSGPQRLALEQLEDALHHLGPPGNPYAAARPEPW
jgi:hypothetical protein